MDDIQSVFHFLNRGVSPWHAAAEACHRLEQAGCERLDETQEWKLVPGKRYFVTRNGSAVLAFRVPEGRIGSWRIALSHSDAPTWRIKNAGIEKAGCVKLETEGYGGMIMSTWLDRPLTIAGRVVLRTSGGMETRLVYADQDLLVIPNLAIHMNREVNRGVELNPQVDMQPLAGLDLSEHFVREALGETLGVETEAILDYDLFTYNTDTPMTTGWNGEFLSSPRLDDLVMVSAAMEALIENTPQTGVTVLAALDHEEIGSRTPQGGGSAMVSLLLEKIAACLGLDRRAFMDALTGSFMLSADVAHAVHPNHSEAHDVKVYPILGGGPVIKLDAGQRYMTNAADYSVYRQICEREKVPVQTFISRADKVSGSTLGPVMCAYLPCRIVDIGTPILSMHSAREMMAWADYEYTWRSFCGFYKL